MKKLLSITTLLFSVLFLTGCANDLVHYSGMRFEPSDLKAGSIVNTSNGFDFAILDENLEISEYFEECVREDLDDAAETHMTCSTADKSRNVVFSVIKTTRLVSSYNQILETYETSRVSAHSIVGAYVADSDGNKMSDKYKCVIPSEYSINLACLIR